ncbi:hypothetical protein C8R44DRAFT_786846 [Mycena epipterygia]|nr:hypothetical protein C8R44DRAFT_786846 [Mycena epipterygia]
MCTAYMVGASPCHRRPRAPDLRGVDDGAGGESDAWSSGQLLTSCPAPPAAGVGTSASNGYGPRAFDPSAPPHPRPGAGHDLQEQDLDHGMHAHAHAHAHDTHGEDAQKLPAASHSDTSIVPPPPFLRSRPASSLHACPPSPRRRSPYVTGLGASMDATRAMTKKTGTIFPPLIWFSTLSAAARPPPITVPPLPLARAHDECTHTRVRGRLCV